MIWQQVKCKGEGPDSRAAHSSDIIQDKLFIFGGWNGSQALNDLHILDLKEMAWLTTDIKGDLPKSRNNHTTAVVGTKILMHAHSSKSYFINHRLNDVAVFESQSMTWFKPTFSDTAVIQNFYLQAFIFSKSIPAARACHTLNKIGKKLYMFGGYNGQSCFNDIDVLDIETYIWSRPKIEGGAPTARNAHCMVTVGTNLYLFGGHTGTKHLKDTWIFETESLVWKELTPSAPTPKGLRGHTANLVENNIYIFGGYDGGGRSNELYIFDLSTCQWLQPKLNYSESIGSLPSGRQRHSASTINNNNIIIFGGFDGSKWLNDLYIFSVGKFEDVQFKTENVNQLVKNIYEQLFNQENFSDCLFLVEDKKIYAHKAILGAQNEHFRAMFTGDMKETTKPTFEIKDWSYEAFVAMIEFFYSANLSDYIPLKITIEILKLSDAYLALNLKKLCQKRLAPLINAENCCDMLVLSGKYSANDLKEATIIYIIKNFSHVCNTEQYEQLEKHPSLLIEVTRRVFANVNMKEM